MQLLSQVWGMNLVSSPVNPKWILLYQVPLRAYDATMNNRNGRWHVVSGPYVQSGCASCHGQAATISTALSQASPLVEMRDLH